MRESSINSIQDFILIRIERVHTLNMDTKLTDSAGKLTINGGRSVHLCSSLPDSKNTYFVFVFFLSHFVDRRNLFNLQSLFLNQGDFLLKNN